MSILTAQNLSKLFGPDEIFADVSIQIPQGAKIALVGPNGAGKTTLLNILIGKDSANSGEISYKRGLTIGHLPQRPILTGERSVWDEMLTAFMPLLEMQGKLAELSHDLADPTKEKEHDQLLERYGKLQETFEQAGGYIYEIEIKRVLLGLGFKDEEFSQPLSQLSGGQVTRALLGRLLLEKPELLALDEPTNHLDIQAVEWLEGYLKTWQGAVLLVSHDRYFMDRVVDTIWELDFGELEVYRGNYSHYLRQRGERYERLMKDYEAQQEFLDKQQAYIRRNMAGQNTRQAKGRLKRLERLPLIRAPRRRHEIHIRLEASSVGQTGKQVLKTQGLKIGYPHKPLFSVPDILLLRGEVAAIIGANGAGKTTFLKTILSQLKPLAGEVIWGSKVQIGYFAQAHEALNDEKTLLEELLTVENLPISQARNYLALYLFTGDEVFRKVSTLSGGERGRLALAKLALAGANVLLLDEPTNHLDIPSQEVLQNVLAEFEGTILLVSHDRYLVDALATQIWAVGPGKMTVFEGSYEAYVEDRAAKAEGTKPPQEIKTTVPNGKEKHPSGLNLYQRRKRLEELEQVIDALEAKLAQLSNDLARASGAGQVEQVAMLGEAYNATESELNDRMAEWMNLA